MKRYFGIGIGMLCVALALAGVGFTVTAQTATPIAGETLRDSLQKKAEELQKIQTQKDAVQKNLDTVLQSKNSLNREIKILDSNISQLNLSIKANKLNIEKLSSEIDILGDDIAEMEVNIENQQATVEKLFVSLQERDRDSTLVLILRSARLSEAVSEMQSISSLNLSLSNNVQRLAALKDELSDRLNDARVKKDEREQERGGLVTRQYIVKDQKEEKNALLSRTKQQETVYQKQISELEKVQGEISEEIEKIESVLRKNIDPNLLPIPRKGLFAWPVPGGRFTQDYGNTVFARTHYKSQRHNGVDIGGAGGIGATVVAGESGVVINVGDQDRYCPRGAYGKFVVIKHDNGLTTLYGHLSRYAVSIGTTVKRGELIGYMGRTGYATGPHLHFTVFASQTLTPARPGVPEGTQPSTRCGPMPVGGDINPMLYL